MVPTPFASYSGLRDLASKVSINVSSGSLRPWVNLTGEIRTSCRRFLQTTLTRSSGGLMSDPHLADRFNATKPAVMMRNRRRRNPAGPSG